jgi:hypothetical protein
MKKNERNVLKEKKNRATLLSLLFFKSFFERYFLVSVWATRLQREPYSKDKSCHKSCHKRVVDERDVVYAYGH